MAQGCLLEPAELKEVHPWHLAVPLGFWKGGLPSAFRAATHSAASHGQHWLSLPPLPHWLQRFARFHRLLPPHVITITVKRKEGKGSLAKVKCTTTNCLGGQPCTTPLSSNLLEPRWLEPKWLEPKWLRIGLLLNRSGFLLNHIGFPKLPSR